MGIILKRKRKLVALPLLLYRCIVTINVWLFLTGPWVGGLQCIIVVFPDHTRLLFNENHSKGSGDMERTRKSRVNPITLKADLDHVSA